MSKRQFIVCVVWLLSLIPMMADSRDAAQALRIAQAFQSDNHRTGLTGQNGRTSRTGLPASYAIADSTAAYFAVNTPAGFVLVGTDDDRPTILGYSDTPYDYDSLPPALRYVLEGYNEEVRQVGQIRRVGQIGQNRQVGQVRHVGQIGQVEPLLSSRWGQNTPYNNLAPVYNSTGSRCVAGCVAVAMAQIMYYYRYPVRGTGSHSYLWMCEEDVSLSRVLTAQFDSADYAWSDMLPTYTGYATAAQQSAVATLMYHCGVAVDMGYGASSGAYLSDVPTAMESYFGYGSNYERIPKNLYAADSLAQMIRAELRDGRPVLVSGANDEGSHAFVCDGYNEQGYFHINWGWKGSSDGYFLLTALNPGSQGIGGTSGGYNRNTTFYVGLCPATLSQPVRVSQMGLDSLSVEDNSIVRSASWNVRLHRIENFGLHLFEGYYGVALYDELKDSLVAVLSQSALYSLRAGYHRTTVASMSVMVPATVEEGTYRLCGVYKDKDEQGWRRLLCTQSDDYLTVYVDANTVSLVSNTEPAVLQLSEPIAFACVADSVPMGGAPLQFSIANTGGTFRGDISARIYKGAFSRGQYEIATDVVIRRNTTLQSALQQAFDGALLTDTPYTMRLCYRMNATDAWHNFEPAEYDMLSFILREEVEQEEPQVPSAVDEVENADKKQCTRKIIEDGRIVILRDGMKYSVLGHKLGE